MGVSDKPPADGPASEAFAASWMKAIALTPDAPLPHFRLATHYFATGNKFAAKAACEQAVTLNPFYAEAWTLLGRIAAILNDVSLAIHAFATAIALTPLYDDPRQALRALCDARKLPLPTVTPWPPLRTEDNNTDWVLPALDDEAQLRALLAKGEPNAFIKLALVLIAPERLQEAACFVNYVLSFQPKNVNALLAKSALVEMTGDTESAAKLTLQAFTLMPTHPMATTQSMSAALNVAQWGKYSALLAQLETTPPGYSEPAASLFYTSDPKRQADIAAAWGARFVQPVHAAITRRPKSTEKPTIGYISADYAPHPIGRWIAALLPHHDREAFTIRAYSVWPGQDNPVRARVQDACASFTELYGLSSFAAAQKIADDGVDILVDITGYTQHCRPDILAHQPAPVQVNYAGYLGTMGVPFMQYQISDATIAANPDKLQSHEALVRLPHSFLAGDRHEFVKPAPPVSRRDVGLPDTAVVFCNFSLLNRINPPMFDVWMRILKRVPESVLWLARPSAPAAQRLQAEAFMRDVDPKRIIFCERTDYDNYLQRLALADLFLDTLPHNAGAVAMDTLWMGCPLLTCPGDIFQSRIGAGMVRAAGIPELAVTSLTDYEELAVSLGHSRARLEELKMRLRNGRDTKPMYNPRLLVRHLEWAYRAMWQRHETGQPPALIDVPAVFAE
jgi:predicted O-linked N-acetylglucosamine transferase (SPINDLY family)